jgi:hypothetical protein
MKKELTDIEKDRIIEMAWEDRTTLKPSSFRMWRARVQGRKTKHEKLRDFREGRFKCSRQRQINNNKIAKR